MFYGTCFELFIVYNCTWPPVHLMDLLLLADKKIFVVHLLLSTVLLLILICYKNETKKRNKIKEESRIDLEPDRKNKVGYKFQK